jgi:hypothetical protein
VNDGLSSLGPFGPTQDRRKLEHPREIIRRILMATGRATQPSSKERLTPIEATPLKMGPIESVRPAISSSRFLLRRFAGSGAPGALAFSTPASSFAQLLENPSQFPAPCHISHPFIGPGAEMRGPHFLANAWRRFRAKLGATEESLGLAGRNPLMLGIKAFLGTLGWEEESTKEWPRK